MSEPMSSGDIEDVLSSIRRLVSEDLRPVSQKAPDVKDSVSQVAQAKRAMPKHSTTGAGGKLLLTPALRVVSDELDAPEAPYEFVEDEQRPEPALLLRVKAQPTEIAAEEPEANLAATQASDEDWLPENTEEFDAIPGWAPEEMPAETQSESPPALDVTRVVSEIAAGVSAGDDEWESETGDAPAMAWQAPEWSEEAEVIGDEPLSASAAKAIADKAEAAAVAEILASATEFGAGLGAGTGSDSDAPAGELRFDEQVLRDLVRDLIHQELSGPLGERITRNVRKLVRTEINRVQTTNALD